MTDLRKASLHWLPRRFIVFFAQIAIPAQIVIPAQFVITTEFVITTQFVIPAQAGIQSESIQALAGSPLSRG
jgi:hypothetical protein